ncbi:hypothetical protein [Thiorhodococcus mannitoliphagus]|uniref:hypothetical protein n=1 Tax=Thiorhodococcus mannitoliphagus TaxID=329406 RepID=UPI0030B87262
MPGDTRGRPLFAALSLLLAALALVCLWGLIAGAPQGDADGAGDALARQRALAQWEALWSDLAACGEAALRPELGDTSLRAAGDTVFMRYRNLWGQVDEDARHGLQMAALSSDPQRKLDLLRPLVSTADPLTGFRALLEMARVQLRLGALEPAREAAQRALAVPKVPPRIQADAHFILGVIAWEKQSLDTAETALGRAVAADPGFWDARQLRLLVLARQIGRPRQGVAACLDRTRQMILDLGALPVLAQDRTQFRDIADRFAAQGDLTNPAFALLAGLGYRWAGDTERARITLAGALTTGGRLPAECEQQIIEKADAWLDGQPTEDRP